MLTTRMTPQIDAYLAWLLVSYDAVASVTGGGGIFCQSKAQMTKWSAAYDPYRSPSQQQPLSAYLVAA
jgi:hypothetical protein